MQASAVSRRGTVAAFLALMGVAVAQPVDIAAIVSSTAQATSVLSNISAVAGENGPTAFKPPTAVPRTHGTALTADAPLGSRVLPNTRCLLWHALTRGAHSGGRRDALPRELARGNRSPAAHATDLERTDARLGRFAIARGVEHGCGMLRWRVGLADGPRNEYYGQLGPRCSSQLYHGIVRLGCRCV